MKKTLLFVSNGSIADSIIYSHGLPLLKSLLMRTEINIFGIQRVKKNPLLGDGLRNRLQFQILENIYIAFPDNSFLYFLWKCGIIGLSLFIFILFRLIKACFFVIKHTKIERVKLMMYGILSGTIGFLLFGLLQANFIAFKILIIFVIMLAYVGFEYEEQINLFRKQSN